MRETKRSAEMRQVLAEYKESGLRRRAFCEQRNIPITTFDYWRRELGARAKPRMVKVKLGAAEPASNFTLTLINGRRIESSWSFGETELARLIRVAESA